MTESGSVVVRRQLGRELRGWRERARRTLEDVAAAQIASISKVQRIEHGRTSVRPGDVRELCRLYDVNEVTTENLVDMARATRTPDWWERHDASAPHWFAMYLRLEAVASELSAFQPTLIHGLAQTRSYAEQVEAHSEPEMDSELVERYVATRMARQCHALERPDPLTVRLVLGEAALATHVGSDDIMRAQRERLRYLNGQEHVTIRVLPFANGLHTGMRGAFSILNFPDPDDPPVVYIETYEAARYPENPPQVARFRRRFAQIWDLAVPIEEYDS